MARNLLGIALVMLIVAVAPMPYGYYTLLRLVACLAAVLACAEFASRRRTVLASVLAVVALLYNPVFPVRLARELWMPINLVSAATLGVFFVILGRGRHPVVPVDKDAI